MQTLVLGVTSPKSCVLLKGQLRFMAEHDYRVFIMAGKSESIEDFCKEEKCTYIPISIKREIAILSDLKSLFEVYSVLKKLKPDIVNLGTPKMGLIGMLASYFLRVPIRIYTCRGFRFETECGFLRKVLIFMERLSGYCASRIICISPSLVETAIKLNIFPKKKIVLINKGSSNGVDLNLFSKERIDYNVKSHVISTYFLDNHFVFGFVGRLCKDKGIIELYDAFTKIYNENRKLRLILIGKIEEDLDEIFVSKLFKHEGIIYLGTISKENLPTYYSLFDVFVLPTHREGFGNVLIEAASMGIPIVTTSVTGAKDAIKDGYNGILVPVNNASYLKAAMEKLYNNMGLRKQYGYNGQLWAKNFNQEIIWNGLLMMYKGKNI